MTVVDFGAGVGAYSFAAAELLDPQDKVYAIEIQKDLLETIRQEAKARNLSNIEIIWGDIEQTNGVSLPDSVADVVIISNVLFQARSMYTLALEAKRLLKAGGRVLVIDWSESFGNLGPTPDNIVTADEVQKTFASAGFSFVSDFLAGDHHYGLIFVRQ